MLKMAAQQGRRREETGGVPSGAHGATNKEHHVCARRRVVRRPGPRWGFRWVENEAGGLFQHPVTPRHAL